MLGLYQTSEQLNQSLDQLDQIASETKKSEYVGAKIIPAIEALRDFCDQAESMIADNDWSLPKYREMLLTLGSC